MVDTLSKAQTEVLAALDIFDTAADMRPLVELANGQEDRAYDAMLGLVEGTAAFDTAVDRWEMCRWIATTTHTRYRTLRSREGWARLMGLPVK